MRSLFEHIATLAKWRIALSFVSLCGSVVFGYKIVRYIQTGKIVFNSGKYGLEFIDLPAVVMTGAMFIVCLLCAVYYLRSGENESE